MRTSVGVQDRVSIISSSNACAMTVRLAASCYVFGVFAYGIFLLHHFSHAIARCALHFHAPLLPRSPLLQKAASFAAML